MSGIEGGWTNYGNSSRKFHFTQDPDGDGMSLCGKWARSPFAGGRALNIDGDAAAEASKDDCAACRRKLNALKDKATA